MAKVFERRDTRHELATASAARHSRAAKLRHHLKIDDRRTQGVNETTRIIRN
jgi:hypothetical protein